jgi:transcription elongation GreA/GreB family factor
MPEPAYLTAEGLARLKTELAELKSSARTNLAARLRSAIQMGDLSENADYHKAKEDQGFLEGRIQELEYLVRNAVIIEPGAKNDKVDIGARITIQEEDDPAERPITWSARRRQIRATVASRTNPPSAAHWWADASATWLKSKPLAGKQNSRS